LNKIMHNEWKPPQSDIDYIKMWENFKL
jgi:hypothetical protein